MLSITKSRDISVLHMIRTHGDVCGLILPAHALKIVVKGKAVKTVSVVSKSLDCGVSSQATFGNQAFFIG